MTCSGIDLNAFHFGELSGSDRTAAERHVRECAACAGELDRLAALDSALRMLPSEPMPQRISFVSDKIFEPRWYQRFWNPGPAWGVASMFLVVCGLGLNLMYRPEPLIVSKTTRVGAREVEALVEAEVARRMDTTVKAAVAQAVADSEARQRKVFKAELEKVELDNQAQVLSVRENVAFLQKKLNATQILSARSEVGEAR
jgi:hypothetical protein